MDPRGALLILLTVAAVWLLFREYRAEYFTEASTPETFDIYLINLSQDTKRLQHFMKQFNGSDLANFSFTRIDAVDGKNVDLKGVVTTKAYNEIVEAELRGHRIKHYQLTRGAVGCYMSHLNALTAVEKSGKDFGIIFEDDVVFKPGIFKDIQEILTKVPNDWDMILLGYYCLKCEKVRGGQGNYNLVKRFFGTQAYMINQKGIRKVFAGSVGQLKHQIDHQFSNMSESGVLKIYATPTSIAQQATHKFMTRIQIPLKRKFGVDPFADS